ncbi:MAG: L,D-transpeptidase family protein, partial [Elusimicrobia bacterium]|nr:L,D-transpeptidase family protein [Elusimicrobiota bacterium]
MKKVSLYEALRHPKVQEMVESRGGLSQVFMTPAEIMARIRGGERIPLARGAFGLFHLKFSPEQLSSWFEEESVRLAPVPAMPVVNAKPAQLLPLGTAEELRGTLDEFWAHRDGEGNHFGVDARRFRGALPEGARGLAPLERIPVGTEVRAPFAGQVVWAGPLRIADPSRGVVDYGVTYVVESKVNGKTMQWGVSHMFDETDQADTRVAPDQRLTLNVGDVIGQGQVIGHAGNTGNAVKGEVATIHLQGADTFFGENVRLYDMTPVLRGGLPQLTDHVVSMVVAPEEIPVISSHAIPDQVIEFARTSLEHGPLVAPDADLVAEAGKALAGHIDRRVVAEGETIETIAQAAGIAVQDLRNYNALGRDAQPSAGATILIPRYSGYVGVDRSNGRMTNIYYDLKTGEILGSWTIQGGVGREGQESPVGTFKVFGKAENPLYPDPHTPGVMIHPGDVRYPYGPSDRKNFVFPIRFDALTGADAGRSGFAIHDSNDPQGGSSGCFRVEHNFALLMAQYGLIGMRGESFATVPTLGVGEPEAPAATNAVPAVVPALPPAMVPSNEVMRQMVYQGAEARFDFAQAGANASEMTLAQVMAAGDRAIREYEAVMGFILKAFGLTITRAEKAADWLREFQTLSYEEKAAQIEAVPSEVRDLLVAIEREPLLGQVLGLGVAVDAAETSRQVGSSFRATAQSADKAMMGKS